MTAPKRFPDRDEIARRPRDECEPLEAGATAATTPPDRRPRDGAPRHGQARLPRRRRPLGPDPGDLRDGEDRRDRRAPRRRRRRRRAGPAKSRRGEPSLLAESRRGARAQHAAAAGHVPRAHRRRAALPQALPRPAHERGDARDFVTRARVVTRGPARPSTGGLRRGRDAGAAAALRRRVRAPVRHASQRARRRPLPPDRDRALPQAAHRRRPRARLRARQGLPQRGRLVQAQPRVHDARVVRGVRRLPTTRWRGSRQLVERVAREVLGTTRVPFRGHEIELEGAVGSASASSRRSSGRSSGRATRTSCAPGSTSAASTPRPTRTGRSSSTTRSATSSSRG